MNCRRSKALRSRLLVAVVVVGVCAVAGARADAQNLVPNASFDYDVSGWELPGATVEVDFRSGDGSDLPGGSGPGCAEVRHYFWNGGSSGPGQVVGPVTAGATYQLEGSYLLPSADNVADGVALSLYWLDVDGRDFAYDHVSAWPIEADHWMRLNEEFVAPAGAASVWLRLMVGNPNLSNETRPGIVYFDDIWFAEAGVDTASQVLFVPAAASVSGVGGTFWTTNGWFSNLVDFPVTLAAAFLPQGQGNAAAVASPIELGVIPPHGFLQLDDLVARLGVTEVAGGVYVLATADAGGQPALLVAGTTHTFTPNPSGDGVYGQGLPAVSAGGRQQVVAPGLYQGASFRTNVGVLNTSADTITVALELRDPAGGTVVATTWTLAPYEQRQQSLRSLGVTQLQGGTLLVTRQSQLGTFRAYTSTVDQASGDAVYNEAR